MTGQRQYKITDYRFGQMILGLREKLHLTQNDLSVPLAVSRRTIQHWEAGTTFPDSNHLKELIAYFLQNGAFNKGYELEEAVTLWEQYAESASRQKTDFDQHWFSDLMGQLKTEGSPPQPKTDPRSSNLQLIDWGDAPEILEIYGRSEELTELKDWADCDHTRVLSVLGMGGIGKTTLVVKLVQDIANDFEFVIWRSLRNAPPLDQMLLELIHILDAENTRHPSIQTLFDILQKRRVLIVFDNLETIHKVGEHHGRYREGYEDYKNLFLQLSRSRHKSLLILTSRKMPVEIEPLDSDQGSVRVMRLIGLPWKDIRDIVREKGLFGSNDAWSNFVHYYSGNPLALKIAASTIQQLFGGDLGAFLKDAPVTLHILQDLLEDQFNNISDFEREIMYWLAIERFPVSFDTLHEEMTSPVSKTDLLLGLLSLRQRSLLEREDTGAVFYLQPVLLEFVTNKIVENVCDTISKGDQTLIQKYPLLKCDVNEYIYQTQARMIVMPILERLSDTLGNPSAVSEHLRSLVNDLRTKPKERQGYAGGNLLNLLANLNGHLRDEDLSKLSLVHAHLHGIEAQGLNLSGSTFSKYHFTEPIDTMATMTIGSGEKYVAAGSYNGKIHLMRLNDGSPLWASEGAEREWVMSFNHDESLLASGGYTGEVCLWDTSNGNLIKKISGHRVWTYSCAFTSDGKYLATGGFYGSIRVWNVPDLSLHMELEGHTNSVYSVAFNGDSTRLVSSGRDGTIRIWDVSNGSCLFVIKHSEKETDVHLAIQPSGNIIVSCSEEDPMIKLWKADTGELLEMIDTRSLGSVTVAIDNKGEIFARGNKKGYLGLWKVDPELGFQFYKSLSGHQHQIETVVFANNSTLASLSFGDGIKLWNAEKGILLNTIKGYSRLIATTEFSMDGKLLIQADHNGMIRIWDIENQRYLANFRGHAGPVWKIVISADNRKFATCAEDCLVKLWDLKDFGCIKTLEAHVGRLFELAFNADGTLLASGGMDRKIILWSAANDNNVNPIMSLEELYEMIWSLTFHPDGKTLVSGHMDGKIHFWDLETGTIQRTLTQKGNLYGDLVKMLRFSPDGRTLFSSTENELINRWDLVENTHEAVQTPVLGNRNKAVVINADGTMVLTGCAEPQVCCWIIKDKEPELIRLKGHNSRVWAVGLSPDEKFIASSDEEGVTIITDAQTREIVQRIVLDRPYERMNISDVKGLSVTERDALEELGAITNRDQDAATWLV